MSCLFFLNNLPTSRDYIQLFKSQYIRKKKSRIFMIKKNQVLIRPHFFLLIVLHEYSSDNNCQAVRN